MQSLKHFNTFGIDVSTTNLINIRSLKDLDDLSFSEPSQYFILGGGSNILMTQDIAIPVLKNELKGIEIINETNEVLDVRISSGEHWHSTVVTMVGRGYGGIENLALIPGTVGAAPIQNIGAYGVEVSDVLLRVGAYDIINKRHCVFEKEQCELGYRDSFFKRSSNIGRYFITYIEVQLQKVPHRLKLDYGRIAEKLDIENPSIKDVMNAVVSIRQSKLPDPNALGNSGSFFKNPIVTSEFFSKLQQSLNIEIPHYITSTGVKIPAGWLIEQCGWKGKRVGNTGTYKYQALILVNYGEATGKEILDHARRIQQSVKDRFGINLDMEVNVI